MDKEIDDCFITLRILTPAPDSPGFMEGGGVAYMDTRKEGGGGSPGYREGGGVGFMDTRKEGGGALLDI